MGKETVGQTRVICGSDERVFNSDDTLAGLFVQIGSILLHLKESYFHLMKNPRFIRSTPSGDVYFEDNGAEKKYQVVMQRTYIPPK